MKHQIILGIESSCDETSAALIKNNKILSHIIYSQDVHKIYGGVVPELASRSHQINIIPIINKTILLANINKNEINAVAFTRGPGLMGSLLVGASLAKSFAISLGIPIIGIHHEQAHILAHFINGIHKYPPKFPFLCLTVSGGHTKIVKVNDFFEMTVLGNTIDDTAGEAFDKIARICGLGYPGGQLINFYAKKGNPTKFCFSKPKVSGLNFSFSGLKTHILYFLEKKLKKDSNFIKNNIHDICASLQQTIIDILLEKIKLASLNFNIDRIVLSGGVSANTEFRKQFIQTALKQNMKPYILPFEYTKDNAAMIAMVGQLKCDRKLFDSLNITPCARYDLKSI
ncbi:MAG: tRNA (adenosine(37)-N6)-threonylcarbamoyltransferase complex transferase subunit TsaD [Candidatus Bostrichicola ureolyticus]|nr:MAG: tRNA (adenosine(37)-N6)-threonylcarbamoyltransferase complex transferase subunit TsaD [Candidatus Bostrichicola ureolyticus]